MQCDLCPERAAALVPPQMRSGCKITIATGRFKLHFMTTQDDYGMRFLFKPARASDSLLLNAESGSVGI